MDGTGWTGWTGSLNGLTIRAPNGANNVDLENAKYYEMLFCVIF